MRKWQPLGITLAFIVVAFILFLRADHPAFMFDAAGTAIENPQVRDLGKAWAEYRSKMFTPGPNALGHFSFALSAAMNRSMGQPDFDITGFLALNIYCN